MNYQRELSLLMEVSHIIKPKNFRDVQNLYQHKASMDMTLDEFKYLTSTCWNERYLPLTIDMTKDILRPL